MRSTTQYNHKKRVLSQINDLLRLTSSFKLSQREYLDRLEVIRQGNSYTRLTGSNRSYIAGYLDHWYNTHMSKAIVFSYEIAGSRYATHTPEYKQAVESNGGYAALHTQGVFDKTGQLVWESDISKIWG